MSLLREFLSGPPGVFVLAGYAGTGKTTLVVDGLRSASGKVCFTAPTHKAVGVLSGRGAVHGADYATIHRLLGCKKQRNNGATEFVPDFDRACWEAYDVLVCDEISMVGEQMWSWLMEAQNVWPRHVICMGDPAQLPPVKDGDGLSPAFARIDAQLTEVMRSAGVVLGAASLIRQHLHAVEPISIPIGQDSLGEVIELERDAFIADAVEAFRREEDAKVLAWTNDAVNYVNGVIRRHLFGDDVPDTPQPGELRVVVSTWSDPGESVMLHAEQEIVIQRVTEVEYKGLPAWKIHADVGVPLYQLRPEGLKDHKKRLSNLRHECRARRKPWRDFYALQDAFIDMRPGYATTVHKSQGSTYQTAYVIDCNLRGCPDPAVRNMLRYVAVSRAAKRLVLS